MTYSKIVLTNQEGYDLEIVYDKEKSAIKLIMETYDTFNVVIDEWDSFIAELNKIKSLLISEQ